ncbi:hypothetical protein FQN60_006825, partial [Etheostoma spectabile]
MLSGNAGALELRYVVHVAIISTPKPQSYSMLILNFFSRRLSWSQVTIPSQPRLSLKV